MAGACVNRLAATHPEWPARSWSRREVFGLEAAVSGVQISGGVMRHWTVGLVIFLAGASLSAPAAAQVFYPGSEAQKKASEGAKAPAYDPHDLSGLWRGGAAPASQT